MNADEFSKAYKARLDGAHVDSRNASNKRADGGALLAEEFVKIAGSLVDASERSGAPIHLTDVSAEFSRRGRKVVLRPQAVNDEIIWELSILETYEALNLMNPDGDYYPPERFENKFEDANEAVAAFLAKIVKFA